MDHNKKRKADTLSSEEEMGDQNPNKSVEKVTGERRPESRGSGQAKKGESSRSDSDIQQWKRLRKEEVKTDESDGKEDIMAASMLLAVGMGGPLHDQEKDDPETDRKSKEQARDEKENQKRAKEEKAQARALAKLAVEREREEAEAAAKELAQKTIQEREDRIVKEKEARLSKIGYINLFTDEDNDGSTEMEISQNEEHSMLTRKLMPPFLLTSAVPRSSGGVHATNDLVANGVNLWSDVSSRVSGVTEFESALGNALDILYPNNNARVVDLVVATFARRYPQFSGTVLNGVVDLICRHKQYTRRQAPYYALIDRLLALSHNSSQGLFHQGGDSDKLEGICVELLSAIFQRVCPSDRSDDTKSIDADSVNALLLTFAMDCASKCSLPLAKTVWTRFAQDACDQAELGSFDLLKSISMLVSRCGLGSGNSVSESGSVGQHRDGAVGANSIPAIVVGALLEEVVQRDIDNQIKLLSQLFSVMGEAIVYFFSSESSQQQSTTVIRTCFVKGDVPIASERDSLPPLISFMMSVIFPRLEETRTNSGDWFRSYMLDGVFWALGEGSSSAESFFRDTVSRAPQYVFGSKIRREQAFSDFLSGRFGQELVKESREDTRIASRKRHHKTSAFSSGNEANPNLVLRTLRALKNKQHEQVSLDALLDVWSNEVGSLSGSHRFMFLEAFADVDLELQVRLSQCYEKMWAVQLEHLTGHALEDALLEDFSYFFTLGRPKASPLFDILLQSIVGRSECCRKARAVISQQMQCLISIGLSSGWRVWNKKAAGHVEKESSIDSNRRDREIKPGRFTLPHLPVPSMVGCEGLDGEEIFTNVFKLFFATLSNGIRKQNPPSPSVEFLASVLAQCRSELSTMLRTSSSKSKFELLKVLVVAEEISGGRDVACRSSCDEDNPCSHYQDIHLPNLTNLLVSPRPHIGDACLQYLSLIATKCDAVAKQLIPHLWHLIVKDELATNDNELAREAKIIADPHAQGMATYIRVVELLLLIVSKMDSQHATSLASAVGGALAQRGPIFTMDSHGSGMGKPLESHLPNDESGEVDDGHRRWTERMACLIELCCLLIQTGKVDPVVGASAVRRALSLYSPSSSDLAVGGRKRYRMDNWQSGGLQAQQQKSTHFQTSSNPARCNSGMDETLTKHQLRLISVCLSVPTSYWVREEQRASHDGICLPIWEFTDIVLDGLESQNSAVQTLAELVIEQGVTRDRESQSALQWSRGEIPKDASEYSRRMRFKGSLQAGLVKRVQCAFLRGQRSDTLTKTLDDLLL